MVIKAVLFDIGGVVLKDKLESVYCKIAKKLNVSENEFSELLRAHKEHLLKGKMSVYDASKLVKEYFKIDYDVVSVWESSYLEVMKINSEIVALVHNLKSNYVVGAISNTMDVHSAINKNRKLYDLFNPMIISCDIGLMKPEKEIFEETLKKLNLKSEECIFIDDRIEHLEIPNSMSFKTIHYTGYDSLVHELKNYGVLL